MPYLHLSYEKMANIAVINIISPLDDYEKKEQLCSEFSELCNEIAWDEEIRVIILTGFGGKSISLETNLSRGDQQYQKMFSITKSISKFEKPVIAAIDGDAIGLELELALVCDIRVAVEASRFGLSQIGTGLMPCDGGTQRLSRLVGRGKALEMILTGGVIDAQEAWRIGLVSKFVPSKDLMVVVIDMARVMGSKGPIALKYAKEAIYKGMDMTLEQGLRLETDLYSLIHTTWDRMEGIIAFREKRAPQFKGIYVTRRFA